MKNRLWLPVLLAAGLLTVSPVAILGSPSVVQAEQTDIFFSKQFNPADLVNGKVLQQNPYVVVSTPTGKDNDPGDYLYVLEYVGKGTTGTGLFTTWWKTAIVNKNTGTVQEVVPNISNFPVKDYPHLNPPSDNQGVDFGNVQPANATWATGSGLSTTPIPGWNPTVKTLPLSGFWDVPNWSDYLPYTAYLKAKGVVNGIGDGKFGPYEDLTRAQFAKMMVEAFGVPQSDNASKFADTKGHWAARYIQGAYEANLITGTSDATFEPDVRVRREEAATMVWRYLKSHSVAPTTEVITFSLAGKPDDWAVEAVMNVIGYKLHGPEVKKYKDGTVNYEAQDTMNRQEAAALIALTMQTLGK